MARYESRKKYIAEWKRSRPDRVREQNYWASIRSKEKYPYKVAARLLLNRAVARGEVERPATCSSCGAGGRIHGHHEDYKKPLEVVWLCRKCHCELHSKPMTPPVEVEATVDSEPCGGSVNGGGRVDGERGSWVVDGECP